MPGLAKHLNAMGDDIRPGEPLARAMSSVRLNAIMGAVRALAKGANIRPGPGILLREVGDGVVISSTARGRGGASSGPAPFDISLSGTTATFRAGTINGFLPSNYLSGVTVPLTGTRYLCLSCTASNGQITAASFVADSSAPAAITPYQGQPPVSFKILIGVLIDGSPIKVWGDGNIQADAAEAFKLQVGSPAAGAMPYVIYYTWSLRLT